jgi:mono/diheme cytochrome c family protein
MSFLRPVAVLSLALMLVAPADAKAELQDIMTEVAAHMHEHLDQINEIKTAVIAGRLEDVGEPASWLATHEEPAWLPSVEEMRHYAARAAAAEDLVAAAAALGEIARTCGDCHQASGVEVAMGYSAPPSHDEKSLATRMRRHLWAADRMWASLVSPSDMAWKQGAEVLADFQFAASDIAADSEQQGQLRDLTERSRAIGSLAGQAASTELRSGLYGEFLSLCASCHSLTGSGPAGQ